MTEIPEHLLKRSRERREAAGLPTEGGDAPAASTPAVAAPAAAPAKAAAAPAAAMAPPVPTVKPDPPYIRAAKTRKKMPFWAMSALSMLPLWGFLYIRGVQPQPVTVSGPLAVGEVEYAKCASCHNADGSGGAAGRPLWKGEVLKTFPKIEDQLNWVYNGTSRYQLAGVSPYGDPNREGGPHEPGGYFGAIMPPQGADAGGALTDAQILGVVCHIRYTVSEADPADAAWSEEYAKWCSPTAETFAALEAGATFASADFEAVGIEPRLSAP